MSISKFFSISTPVKPQHIHFIAENQKNPESDIFILLILRLVTSIGTLVKENDMIKIINM